MASTDLSLDGRGWPFQGQVSLPHGIPGLKAARPNLHARPPGRKRHQTPDSFSFLTLANRRAKGDNLANRAVHSW